MLCNLFQGAHVCEITKNKILADVTDKHRSITNCCHQ